MTANNKIKNLPKNLKVELMDNYLHLYSETKNIHIKAKKISLGINVEFGDNIVIHGNTGEAMDSIEIGDNVWMDHDSKILLPELIILDFTKINNSFFAYGTKKLKIGYNCWLGSNIILDTLGGLEISNNVGIASKAQIYSHAKFGDTTYGCRFHQYKSVRIGEDAWITPGCIITMASMADKSMLLGGSVLTKDTEVNKIYAGIPAKDISEKVGTQFESNLDYNKILLLLKKYLKEFYIQNPEYASRNDIEIILDKSQIRSKTKTYFVVKDRKYTKRHSAAEIAFMKFVLPEKAKFIPYNELK